MDIKDEQWAIVRPLLPKPVRRADGRGRPRVNDREILNGILWILRTGARWQDLPERYPPYQTCHRRFQEWVQAGVFEKVLQALVRDVKERGKLDLTECFIDGSFVIAKKGAEGVGKTKRGKGTKLMAVADRAGLPIAISVESASPHEVRLVESTLKSRFTKERPGKLIGDRAYDSDPLDERLRKQGIELIAPHKTNRTKPRTQDGRPLRRYRNRWKIERLFAWLQNFRRIQTRHERILENYLAFVLLGCMIILFRSCF
ncbi:MAG: IS5 family transposase [Anaerolineales bacterium]|nr:MAG: IS5 family transposase [Anaerolineales bacterium]WKZ35150.1 MAG: IS5 family transposase [Anaerolineales bacterium]